MCGSSLNMKPAVVEMLTREWRVRAPSVCGLFTLTVLVEGGRKDRL